LLVLLLLLTGLLLHRWVVLLRQQRLTLEAPLLLPLQV
jgi:hypothetical protein